MPDNLIVSKKFLLHAKIDETGKKRRVIELVKHCWYAISVEQNTWVNGVFV